jgi:hypothetical protein
VSAAVFELAGSPAPELSELAIGPWTRAPVIAAFDAGADPLETLWRVELPRDGAAGRAALTAGERSIAHVHAVLDAAPRRLERLLAAGAPDLLDFAAPEVGRLERVLQRAADLARGRARIETHLEHALAARTVTTLSGDTELWLAPALPRRSAELHARAVAVALHTRQAWTRLAALAVACGGRIATLGVAGAVTALPLVWRFLRDVLRDVRDPDAAAVR